MASIRERPRKGGGITYSVLWRDPKTGEQHSMPFPDRPAEAKAMQALLDANGQSLTVVENALAQAVAEDDAGPTLADIFEEHLDQLTDVGPYQMGRYRASITEHFAELSRRPVSELTRNDIARWVNGMKAKPGRRPGTTMAAKTIANHHGFLSAALGTAVLNQRIAANPCKGIKLPKSTRTEDDMRFIDHAGWARITAAMPAGYLPFFQMLVGSGLRLSEAAALEAADFALDAVTPTVRVTKAWKLAEDGRSWYVGPPKTRKSRRVVSLAPSTVRAVRESVRAAGKGALVFRTESGGPIHPSDAYHRAWKPALDAVGWPEDERPRIHDVRHTHASWMIAAGEDIFALSRRLGHESIKTTMDRYSHLLPDAVFRDAAIAQKALEAVDRAADEADVIEADEDAASGS